MSRYEECKFICSFKRMYVVFLSNSKYARITIVAAYSVCYTLNMYIVHSPPLWNV